MLAQIAAELLRTPALQYDLTLLNPAGGPIGYYPYAASPYGSYNQGDEFIFGLTRYSVLHVAHSAFGNAATINVRTALYLGPLTPVPGVDPHHNPLPLAP